MNEIIELKQNTLQVRNLLSELPTTQTSEYLQQLRCIDTTLNRYILSSAAGKQLNSEIQKIAGQVSGIEARVTGEIEQHHRNNSFLQRSKENHINETFIFLHIINAIK